MTMNVNRNILWLLSASCVSMLISNAFEFAIVLDCGSKGSRMHIYRRISEESHDDIIDMLPTPKKTGPGLAHFGASPHDAIDYLFPLLVHAATIIPPEAHGAYDREVAKASARAGGGLRGRGGGGGGGGGITSMRTLPVFPSTEVFILGTAGLRMISQEEEDQLFDTIVSGLNDRRGPVSGGGQPFMLRRHQIVTLSGAAEAYYAALSVNFILGTVNSKLHRTYPGNSNSKLSSDSSSKQGGGGHLRLVGAMDLGGASTQIIFPLKKNHQSLSLTSSNNNLDSSHVGTDDFWAASFLHYGSLTIHSRVLRYLATHHISDVSERKRENNSESLKNGENINPETTELIILIHNPCDMVDHVEHWNGQATSSFYQPTSNHQPGFEDTVQSKSLSSYTFIGTGDAAGCSLILRRILWGSSNPFKTGQGLVSTITNEDGLGLDGASTAVFKNTEIQRNIINNNVNKEIKKSNLRKRTTTDIIGQIDDKKKQKEEADEKNGSIQSSDGSGGDNWQYLQSNNLVCVGGSPCPLEGVEMPRISVGVTFVCMSALYRAVNALHLYAPGGLPHFPRPTLLEVQRATENFCAMKWSAGKFSEHDAEELPRVCLHAVYAFTLMRDAYGLDLESRELLFAHSLGGHEISWVIGAALSQFASFDYVESEMLKMENINKISNGYVNDNDDDMIMITRNEELNKNKNNKNNKNKNHYRKKNKSKKAEQVFKKDGKIIHRSDLELFQHIRNPNGQFSSLASTLHNNEMNSNKYSSSSSFFLNLKFIQIKSFYLTYFGFKDDKEVNRIQYLFEFLVLFFIIFYCMKRFCCFSSHQKVSTLPWFVYGRLRLCLPSCCILSRKLSSNMLGGDFKRTKSDDEYDHSM